MDSVEDSPGDDGGRRSQKSDFDILGKLGSGSYGVVYKVLRKQDQNTYVIKSVRIAELSPAEQDEAINEVSLLARLDSQHVVRYFDSFLEAGTLYIVMEFCNQGDLQGMIKRYKEKGESSLPEKRIWSIFIQIVLGLHYIHRQRVLHRDMKSANVFLSKDPGGNHVVKIGDLGVAKALGTTTAFAHTVVGTPYYLSPELCEDKPYNAKSDIWALGVVLYECCALTFPFTALNQCALVLKIVKDKPDEIPSGVVCDELVKLTKRLLNKNPERRPDLNQILSLRRIQGFMETHGLDLPPGVEKIGAQDPHPKRGRGVAHSPDTGRSRPHRRNSSPEGSGVGQEGADAASTRRSGAPRPSKQLEPRRQTGSEGVDSSKGGGNLRGNRVRGGGQQRVISKKAAKPVGVVRVMKAPDASKKSVKSNHHHYDEIAESVDDLNEDQHLETHCSSPNRLNKGQNAHSVPNMPKNRVKPSLRDLEQAVAETSLDGEGATLRSGLRHSLDYTTDKHAVLYEQQQGSYSSRSHRKEQDDAECDGTIRSHHSKYNQRTGSNGEEEEDEMHNHREITCITSMYDSQGEEEEGDEERDAVTNKPHEITYITNMYDSQVEEEEGEGYSSLEENNGPAKLRSSSLYVFQEGGWSGTGKGTQWRVRDPHSEAELEYSHDPSVIQEGNEDDANMSTLGWSRKMRDPPVTQQLETEYLNSQNAAVLAREVSLEEEGDYETERANKRQQRSLQALQSKRNVIAAFDNYQKELALMIERQRAECLTALNPEDFQELYDIFSQQSKLGKSLTLTQEGEGPDYQQLVLNKCGGDMFAAWEVLYSIQKLLGMESAFEEATSAQQNSNFDSLGAEEIDEEYEEDSAHSDSEKELYYSDVHRNGSDTISRNATIIVSPGKPAVTRDGEIYRPHTKTRASVPRQPHF